MPICRVQCLEAAERLKLPRSLVAKIARAPSRQAAIAVWQEVFPSFKSCWRQQVKSAHPDCGGDAGSFITLSEAWRLVQSEEFAVTLWRARAQRSKIRKKQARANAQSLAPNDIFGFTSFAGNASTTVATSKAFWENEPAFLRRY